MTEPSSDSLVKTLPLQRPEVRVVPRKGIWQPPTLPPPGCSGRVTNKLAVLKGPILKAMWNHKHAWPFHAPVDTRKLGLSDYFVIVKKPMDLGTIKKRLENNYYWSADEAVADFTQLFTNCYIYNKPGDDINVMAKALEKLFFSKMRTLPLEEFEVGSNGYPTGVVNSKLDIQEEALCEYEKIRQDNIMERKAKFAELELEDAKEEASRRNPKKAKIATKVLPRKPSSRLAGVEAAEVELFNPNTDPLIAGTKIPERTLYLKEFGEPESANFLLYLGASKVSTPTNENTHMSRLTINSKQVVKVVPEQVFSTAFHPGHERLVAAAGDKRGNIGLWDCEDTESASHGVHLLRYHSRPVNCLAWDMAQSHLLISTSYDGTMRQLDVNKQESSLVYHDPAFLDAGGWCSFHCQPDENTFLISQQGGVAKVDRRAGTVPVATFDLFEKMLAKSISCFSDQPNLVLVGNDKGGCYIYDLRSSANKFNRLDHKTELLGGWEVAATRSLTSSEFSPDGKQVVTLSFDDRMRLYSREGAGATLMPCAQVKHNNKTNKWFTPFRVCWHPTRKNVLAVGSMEKPRQIELWSTEGGKLTMTAQLIGEELDSVASVVAFHPTREAVIGGNSTGRLHLFM